jgi:hypothetical protein
MIGVAIAGFLVGATLAIVELVRAPDPPPASPPAVEGQPSHPSSDLDPARP